MKNLKDYNNEASDHFARTDGKPVKNGISCHTCGEELYDSRPNVVLTSMPPQKNVHCEKCGFVGYRYQ